MNNQFTHLHLHTDASLRDGMGTVKNMVSHAKTIGFNSLAMTDHGTLANAITFTVECQNQGIKPILGLEGYIEFDGKIGHITLLADGNKGWNSLLKLNNLAHKSEYKQPAFTIDQLRSNSYGLVCLTGCVASPFHQLPFGDAYKLGLSLQSVFGNKLFAEVMFPGLDIDAHDRPLELAYRLKIKPVITNDVHFSCHKLAESHQILTKMKSGFSYDSKELYLKTFDEMVQSGLDQSDICEKDIKNMLIRSGKVGQLLSPVNLKHDQKLPNVGNAKHKIVESVVFGSRKSLLLNEQYQNRFDYEMGIIGEMGYCDYFVILDDIIKNAKSQDVKIGPGRGSGAGSLVLFLMGITDIDPIKHGLQFERFLNPERRGMPDVDIDLDSLDRDKVLDYAAQKYQAVPIATYSRYSHKSLIRDLGKMFKIPQEKINKLADSDMDSKEFLGTSPDFKTTYNATIGQIRHKGKHAGGIIISNMPVPVERVSKTHAAAWTEGQDSNLSYAGIVKFDLLGLNVLSALKELETTTGRFPENPAENDPVFNIFKNGNLSGIFQFSGSDGIRQLTMQLQPNKFSDLVAINALYRPGAIDAGSTEKFIEWKKSPRLLHPSIDSILSETYGAIVYQEQVMSVYATMTNGTLASADNARRVIAKFYHHFGDLEWIKKLEGLKQKFIDGAYKNHKIKRPLAEKIWSEIETHTRYSFNKSHSTAYAMLAWQTAWYKFNFPGEFYAAMLNIDQENKQTYIMDAVKSGIELCPPHVNVSGINYVYSDDKIYLPLNSIKFMGNSGASAIINERSENGRFATVEDFMSRIPKSLVRSRGREGLYFLGGMSGIESGEDDQKLLKLTAKEFPETIREKHLKYLGHMIPKKSLLERMQTLENSGMVCGIIDSKDVRKSKWGEYAVYRLSPNGLFWSKELSLFENDIVAVKVGDKARALEIEVLNYE